MALHASVTIVTQAGNLKHKDRMFADTNESFIWEVANRSGIALSNVTIANFINSHGTAVQLKDLFKKIVPIATLAINDSGAIRAKLKNNVPADVYAFDIVYTDASGFVQVIADPEMEVCSDITFLEANLAAGSPLEMEKKRAAKKPTKKAAGKK